MTDFRIDKVDGPDDVQTCLDIRNTVFVEEQGVPVDMEIDAQDHGGATHFLGRLNGKPVAAARICVFYGVAKIQRVAMLVEARGNGHGAALVAHLMDHVRQKNLAPVIALDSQTHATGFYERLGFLSVGEPFDDAGIPHIRMETQA